MDTSHPYRPRVSRETRLLLAAGLTAVAALWLLARFRFPERPVSPNPVPAVLSQLASGPPYDELARQLNQLHERLQPSLLALGAESAAFDAAPRQPRAIALRMRDDLAVTVTAPGTAVAPWSGITIVARDPASGLAVVRTSRVSSAPAPAPWTPRQTSQGRYLAATDVSSVGVSLRPVYLGSLVAVDSAAWPDPVWAVPWHAELAPGSFLFTDAGELVGLVVAGSGAPTIVPAAVVLEEAERLLAAPALRAGTIGVEVQALTPVVAAVVGPPPGVVVTWVDPLGAASGRLAPGDVVEAVDGLTVTSRAEWDVRMARLAENETVSLRVRREGGAHDVAAVSRPRTAPPVNRSLGLAKTTRTPAGVAIADIEPGSASDRAGLAAGDVITLVADIAAPTPAQLTRAYDAMDEGARVIVAVTRGTTHFVTALER